MPITSEDIKKLRIKTGAGMMDCKKALDETNDIEKAIEWLRKKGINTAQKKSERSATDGLITIEDVIEEITGEIEDEHDEKNLPMLIKSSANIFEASARVEIDELQKVTNIQFLDSNENEDIDTLGGLIFSITGRVPQRGEIIKHSSGTTFEIKDADPMKIKSVKVSTPKK